MHDEAGLASKRSVPHSHPHKTPAKVSEKVIHPRRTYHLRPQRIVWYLEHYHSLIISDVCVYRPLHRNGLNRLPRCTRVFVVHTRRYNKQVPRHHTQIEVKFLNFIGEEGRKVHRFEFTATYDARGRSSGGQAAQLAASRLSVPVTLESLSEPYPKTTSWKPPGPTQRRQRLK